ncbi:PQQ-binding-like beta-propeller repeat protein [Planctomycetes bacterium K23_9]|uniref:Outer membrane biogenesis protein BamB n=1 Tax=Stieleria marina TaxID=1930275 RepID=A0A517NS77_9BACT|nr:outer membrane biogenesis protein BamB [Planctomycetes bacterium K23_9]
MNRCFQMLVVGLAFANVTAVAEDWPRFRGVAGSGVAGEASSLPDAWSPDANVAWKTELPGPGASSPIIVGGKAFVTCYSGYGLTQEDPGEIENLVRHLVCIDVKTGKKLWQKDVKATLPEDPYSGIGVTAHGYASHTPVCDGTNVYAFFGKGGVHAFDMDGKALWNADAGKESDPAKWGSSSSPVVYKDSVIVTASAESQAIISYDKTTGKELWRQEAKGLDGMWGTPALVKVGDNRTDLVMCVAKEVWGLDPANGKLRWFADATGAEQAYSSVILDGKRVYAFTGRGGGSIALDAGGSGDVSDSKTIWTGTENASFASPVRHESKIYVVSRGVLTIVDAESGKRLKQLRLKGVKETGGRFGSLDYPSPIVVGDRLYYLNGSGQMFVFGLGDDFEQLAVNEVTSDKETFWGSPAVSDGRLLMRSSKHLYCVTDQGDTVKPRELAVASADKTPEAAGRGSGRGPGGAGGGARGGGPNGGAAGGRGGPGGGRPDPLAMFNGMDADKDGKVTMAELEGNRIADRLKTLDKDGDESISKEEFTSGIGSLFRGGGGGRGGSGGGGGGYGNRGKDSRPDRPQRPELVEG